LPTPRVTPVESKIIRPARASHLSNPAPEAPIKQDLMAQTSSQTLVTNDIAPTVTTPDFSQTVPVISSMPPNVMESFPQTSYNMQMPNMTSMPMPPQMNPMMMAQIAQYMMMMNPANYPYNSQAQPTDFNPALIDASRMYNGQWPNSQLPQGSPLQSNMYERQTLSSTQQNYPYPDLSSNLVFGSNSQSTPIETPVRKRRRASSASSDSISMQDVLKNKIKSESTSPVTERQSKAGPSATQSSERKLFQSKSGKELSFFVQVEMHNRSAVVASIKVKYNH
jgi:hypothetical protein